MWRHYSHSLAAPSAAPDQVELIENKEEAAQSSVALKIHVFTDTCRVRVLDDQISVENVNASVSIFHGNHVNIATAVPPVQ